MLVKFKQKQTVTALNGKVYTLSELCLRWKPNEKGLFPVWQRALIKNDSNQYFVAEYSETSWVKYPDGGWNMIHVPTVTPLGIGHESGEAAMESFLKRHGERLLPLN